MTSNDVRWPFSLTILLNFHNKIIKSIFFKLIFIWWLSVINLNLVNCDVDNSRYNNNILNRNSLINEKDHFTPTWAVHIPGGKLEADRVAVDHGFINLGQIVNDYYHFHHHSIRKRSLNPSHNHQNRLDDDHRVHWAKQQTIKSRKKRDYKETYSKQEDPRNVLLYDPKWSQMWYLNRGEGLDMNVIPAWKQGVTGKGVVVTILDDGLETDHPDLINNYDPRASYDVNSHDDDPMPHYDMTDSNRHGTRCAGEVAATANNSICAVGIAFDARVGAVRMLDGDVTDAVEARSLSLNIQHIDIYSASWGPDDDGKTVDGPGELATHAFIDGVTKGRGGKGSIFIWASGNGGREYDNCNCDGYTNSIWTLSISSATEEGNIPWYSEKCSSTLATTYSSGGANERQVVTTDLHHSCTGSHTGTSASAPLAAGIAALVLETNRNLTWRDLQHIVVRTAKPGKLQDATWSVNGVGRRVSHSFGYGLMDAAAMVNVARNWKTVPEQQRCEINAPHLDKSIAPKQHITLQLSVTHCKGVNFLEHVQAKITLTSQRRGDIQIYLKSPAGTKVTLLTLRSHDVSRSGFNQWPFMSVHTWGEAPHGNWQLEIHNDGKYLAQITQWNLILHGTETSPQPDDSPKLPVSELDLLYDNDMGHNSLEFDAETASGQWQQVGVNHVDVQRTASNDQTGSACLNFSPDQKCIVCLQYTFLYEGRCYTSCPERSYIVPEQSINELQRSKFLRDRQNHVQQGQMEEKPEDHQHENGFPISYSLRGRSAAPPIFPSSTIQKLCKSCHFSCLKCRGSNDYDCTACAPDATYTEKSSTETYCYPRNDTVYYVSPSTRQQQSNRKILIFSLSTFIILIIFSLFLFKIINTQQTKNDYVYNRVHESDVLFNQIVATDNKTGETLYSPNIPDIHDNSLMNVKIIDNIVISSSEDESDPEHKSTNKTIHK